MLVGGCIGVVLGLGRVLTYWAAGVLEGWIRGCGGGSEGVTPDSPQITQITPKWPKRAKRVIFGVFGVIQAKWAQMGISRPNMAIWAKYRPNIAYWAYMVLAGPNMAKSG